MKTIYSEQVDALRIVLRDVSIEESDEYKPGTVVDYDANSEVMGIEILNASTPTGNPREVEHVISH